MELCATDKDIRTYIDICIIEHAENPKQKTLHLENFAIINVDSDSIISQKKQNGREEYHQEDCQIHFNVNEENMSIIAIKTIEPNVFEKIEPNTSKTVEPKTIKIIKAVTEK